MEQSPADLSVLASMHTHSRYCDGRGEIAEYAQAALAAGLSGYGASSHSPLPFATDYAMPLDALPAYCSEVRSVQRAYAGRFTVYLGLELDYLPGLDDFYRRALFSRGLDYVVGSVHYLQEPGAEPWCYDASEERFVAEIQSRHGGDARPVIEDYYRRLAQMAAEAPTWGLPVIVGHFDRVALYNRDDRYFPTDNAWYRDLTDTALAAIKASDLVLEVNTSGWYKSLGQSNPGLPILRRAADRGIRMIVSADAHAPEHVARDFARATDLLAEAGVREIVVPDPAGWQSRPLVST